MDRVNCRWSKKKRGVSTWSGYIKESGHALVCSPYQRTLVGPIRVDLSRVYGRRGTQLS